MTKRINKNTNKKICNTKTYKNQYITGSDLWQTHSNVCEPSTLSLTWDIGVTVQHLISLSQSCDKSVT